MFSSPLHAIDWSWSLNEGGGTFTSSESNSSTNLSGTFSRLANGFVEMTTSSGTGDQYPGNGTKFFPIEVPGFFLAVPPLLSSETQMSFNITSGSCPGKTTKYNWTFQGWTGANDLTSANQGVFGEFTWNDVTQSAAINSIYNVSTYANPSWFSGDIGLTVASCGTGSAAVTYETPGTDRSGQMYLSAEGGLIYKTDSNRLIFGVPQVKIPGSAIFYDNYTAYITRYDTSGSLTDNFKPARVSVVSSGASGSGNVLSDVTNNTTDGAYGGISLSIDTINSPVDGMFEGTLTRNSNSGKVICIAHFTSKTILFCASQTEGNTTKPSNLVLVSETGKRGRFDHTFGSGGIFIQDFHGGDNYDAFWAANIDGSNRIVAGGHTYMNGSSDNDPLIVRFLSDGSLDTSFGSGGVQIFSWTSSDGTQDGVKAIAHQSDGKILAAGNINATGWNDFSNTDGGGGSIFRLNTNGTLDTTFATGGRFILQNASRATGFRDMIVDSQGRILATGHYGLGGGGTDSVVVRLLSDGSLDTSFASGGLFIQDFGDGVGELMFTIFIDSNNKIVFGGWGYEAGVDIGALIRLESDGTMDTSFGTGGWVKTLGSAYPGQDWNEFWECIEDSSSKIVCAGYSYASGTNCNFSITRYLTDGSLDTTFNSSGIAVWEVTTGNDYLYSLHEVSGKYVVSGTANNYSQAVVGSVLSDGTMDTEFGSDGTGWVYTNFSTEDDTVWDSIVDSQGRIVLVGERNDLGSSSSSFIYRYWP